MTGNVVPESVCKMAVCSGYVLGAKGLQSWRRCICGLKPMGTNVVQVCQPYTYLARHEGCNLHAQHACNQQLLNHSTKYSCAKQDLCNCNQTITMTKQFQLSTSDSALLSLTLT